MLPKPENIMEDYILDRLAVIEARLEITPEKTVEEIRKEMDTASKPRYSKGAHAGANNTVAYY
jgi:hypothetical protein